MGQQHHVLMLSTEGRSILPGKIAAVAVLEVTTPDKQDRRRRGKNDDLDAQNAAHELSQASGPSPRGAATA